MIEGVRHVDAMGVQSKIILVEEKIQNINHNTIIITIIMISKQGMDVVNNAWKPFLNQINLAYVKYLKKLENLSYLIQGVKYVIVMGVIHKTKGQEVIVGLDLVIN